MELSDAYFVDVRVRQYYSSSRDDYYDLMRWTRLYTGGLQQFTVDVDKNSVKAGGKTVLEFKVTSGNGLAFASGTLMTINAPWTYQTILIPENHVVTVCDEKDGYRFGFNGQMKDDEVAGVGNHNTAMFWEYDTRTGRRWNRDPVTHPDESSYSTFGGNPIRNSDINGDDWWDEVKFAARHHGIANRIGQFSPGSTNISTNAVRFSTRGNILQENENKTSPEYHKMSEVNADRHTLWQATIASKWGSGIAKEAGDAHEDNANAIAGKNDAALKVMTFKTADEADQAVDLANNIIGRKIGEANKGVGMNVLAQKVTDEFHTNGLWTATKQEDGTYKMSKTKITDKQYEALSKVNSGLNDNGFNATEQKERDANAAAGEAAQKKINSTMGLKQ
jgi:hypothetical protein